MENVTQLFHIRLKCHNMAASLVYDNRSSLNVYWQNRWLYTHSHYMFPWEAGELVEVKKDLAKYLSNLRRVNTKAESSFLHSERTQWPGLSLCGFFFLCRFRLTPNNNIDSGSKFPLHWYCTMTRLQALIQITLCKQLYKLGDYLCL